MLSQLFASASGWVLAPLIPATVALPYLLRRQPVWPALRLIGARGKTWLQRMRPHYWLGYFIAGVTLAHAFVAMGTSEVSRVNALGLYLATGVLFLLVGQVILGNTLKNPAAANRRLTRRLHFWSMAGIVTLAAGHIALDSPAIQSLFH